MLASALLALAILTVGAMLILVALALFLAALAAASVGPLGPTLLAGAGAIAGAGALLVVVSLLMVALNPQVRPALERAKFFFAASRSAAAR